MADNNTFLDDKDVVCLQYSRFGFDVTTKLEDIKKQMNKWVVERFNPNLRLFPVFIDKCEVLQQDGKGWKKGRIKICFEFIPDEPDPEEETEIQTKSLDDFRK